MKVSVGVSNHHLHLTKDDYKILFGDKELEIRNDLKQPGQFASKESVTLIGPKGKIENVTIVGPFRNYTQVEISKTDSRLIGIDPPVCDSGDLENAEFIIIAANGKTIERKCAIISARHIHIDSKIRNEKELIGVKEVSLKISGEKSGIIDHVHLKDSDIAFFEVHLDTDDANAFLLNNNDTVEIVL